MLEWEVNIADHRLLNDLLGALLDPDPDADPGMSYFRKARVGQFDGFSVHVFANEHPRPHFRVKYAGESADFSIDDGSHPVVVFLGITERSKPGTIAKKNSKHAWNRMRPTDCPVGPIR